MSRSFKQFLIESPLPDDWDKASFKDTTSFASRVAYAKERAKRLGSGSSRIAFIIPFEGRNTVLKVAKNRKGMAQNEEEAQALGDWYLKSLEITIPMIDYDEESESPTWIHTEMAGKARESDFKKHTGGTVDDLITYAFKVSGRTGKDRWHGNPDIIDEESEFVQSFVDYVGNYTHHNMGDYSRLANWGVYKGNLVIIDMGLTDEVMKTYYSR